METQELSQWREGLAMGRHGEDWAQSQWWHIYPLGALGADTSGQDRNCHRSLRDLIPWLDHARDLGLNGIALGPIFTSEYHGYDTIDHYSIDPRLGDMDDFLALLGAAKERGLVVMLDGVFNHVSKHHPLVQDIDAAKAAGIVRLDANGNPAVFEGHDQLVELNFANAQVRELIVDIICHWLELGVNGWRLDAAYAIPAATWQQLLEPVRARFPHALICGEVIHGDYVEFVEISGVSTVTQYELWKAIWSSLRDANMHELAWCLKRHNKFLEHFLPWTFIANHDVTRIASQFGDLEAEQVAAADAPNAISPRHASAATKPLPVSARQLHGLVSAAVVLLGTLPGIPAVYYGDALGWRGVKEDRLGGDDAIRAELPLLPPNVSDRPEIYRVYQRVLGLRRRIPEVATGFVEVEFVAGAQLVYSVRCAATGDLVLRVALNAAAESAYFSLVSGEVLEADGWVEKGTRLHGATLPPYGWVLLRPEVVL